MSDVEKRIEQWRTDLAGSELLGRSDVRELESHLREEMEHLKTAGLSADEAFLVARRRLGDTAALEEEFAKVSPHRKLTSRLSWMATGVLAYYLALCVSMCLSNALTVLGYAVGLRNPCLTLLTCVIRVGTFAGIGVLLWRYLASHCAPHTAGGRTSISMYVGLFGACLMVTLWFLSLFGRNLLFRFMSREGFTQIALADGWVSISWAALMPFLLVGLIALLTLRDRHSAQGA